MKRRGVAAGLAGVLGLLAVLQAAPRSMAQASKVEDTVLQLVQAWLNAESGGDTAALDKLIAEDFIGTGPGGNILNKSDIVPPAGEERPRMPKSHVKDSAVRLFGNTAVVMGSVAEETQDQPGFRFTLVFLNRGQGWQMIAAHLAGAPPAK